ncbi:MAG: spore coat U domain-containing protein [Terracidiphilus sp.]|jgi:spore coat protein U-like protein
MKFSKIALSALSFAVLGFLALGLASTPASASTSVSTTFNVTATVAASCNITAPTLAFGTYTGGQVTANTAITVTCNAASTPYNIGLNVGLNGTGPYARYMINGTNKLSYGLYQNTALSTNWGTTIGTDTEAGTSSATALTATTVTVYGVIPAAQVVPTGSYADTIMATITY